MARVNSTLIKNDWLGVFKNKPSKPFCISCRKPPIESAKCKLLICYLVLLSRALYGAGAETACRRDAVEEFTYLFYCHSLMGCRDMIWLKLVSFNMNGYADDSNHCLSQDELDKISQIKLCLWSRPSCQVHD